MVGKKVFYVAEISEFAADYYLKCLLWRPGEGPTNTHDYDLLGYSLTELAVLAKFDSHAMDELLWRIHRRIMMTVSAMLRSKPYINYDETCAYVYQQCAGMILAYDPSQGSFDRFLHHSICLYVAQCNIHQCLAHKRRIAALGMKLKDLSTECLYDSANCPKDDIILKADLDMFMSKITPPERELFSLYLENMTFREMAEILKKPISTVSFQIHKLMDQFYLMRLGEEHKA